MTYGPTIACRLDGHDACTAGDRCDCRCHALGTIDGGNVYDDAEDLDGTDPA